MNSPAGLRRVWPLIGAIFIGALVWQDAPRWVALSIQGVATEGTVVQKRPEHGVIGYTYLVEGDTRRGEDRSGDHGAPAYDDVQIGSVVRVTYASGKPEWSTLGNPKDVLLQELTFALVATVGCLFFAWWFWRVRRPVPRRS